MNVGRTLADRVAGELRAHIRSNVYVTGDRLPSTGELCSQFGVSHITVTAALRLLREEGLVESRRRSGVFVLDQSQVRTPEMAGNTLACVVPSLDDPFFTLILSGAEAAAARSGYRLMAVSSRGSREEEARQVQDLAKEAAGLLVFPLSNRNNAVYNGVMDEGVPLVFMDHLPEGLAAPLVCADDEGGAREATRHLIATGHRRNWFLTHPLGNSTSVDDRLKGYRAALREAGIGFDPKLVLQDSATDAGLGLLLMEQLLQRETFREPVGVFVLNDAMVRGCYLALRERGLRCPEDIAVVTFGDNFAPFLEPPVSSVGQPLNLMGDRAAEMLIEICRGGKAVRHKLRSSRYCLPVSFTVRSSSDPSSDFSSIAQLRAEFETPVVSANWRQAAVR